MDSVVHFEIPVDDMDRAKDFYGTVFDWQLADVPGMDYVMANTTPIDDQQMPTTPGAINGGLVSRVPEAPTPVAYVQVSSIDECLVAVEKQGGSVVSPRSAAGGWGSFARFRDPEGNVVGLWENPA